MIMFIKYHLPKHRTIICLQNIIKPYQLVVKMTFFLFRSMRCTKQWKHMTKLIWNFSIKIKQLKRLQILLLYFICWRTRKDSLVRRWGHLLIDAAAKPHQHLLPSSRFLWNLELTDVCRAQCYKWSENPGTEVAILSYYLRFREKSPI